MEQLWCTASYPRPRSRSLAPSLPVSCSPVCIEKRLPLDRAPSEATQGHPVILGAACFDGGDFLGLFVQIKDTYLLYDVFVVAFHVEGVNPMVRGS